MPPSSLESSRLWLRATALCAAAFALSAAPLRGQGLPPYEPLNPVVEMRSGLSSAPWAGDGIWHFELWSDYGNLIEFSDRDPDRFVLDAEIWTTHVTVSRALGSRVSLIGGASWSFVGDGRLDGLLDSFHELVGAGVTGRAERPENEYLYRIRADGEELEYPRTRGYLGDLRIGVGLRHHPGWRSALTITIPTGREPDGFRKGVASINGVTSGRRAFGADARFAWEGSLGFGYTPRTGALREWQRVAFARLTQGLSARVTGPWRVYGNVVLGSPFYRGTGARELDGHELALDIGALLELDGGPTWFLAMTQDLEPDGPAVDVVFRLGAIW